LKLQTFTEGRAIGGGFYLLSAGDNVYCDKTSVVGHGKTSIKGAYFDLEKKGVGYKSIERGK